MYRLTTTKKFDRTLQKLDKSTRDRVIRWLENNLVDCENPRIFGKALTGNLGKYWRYRVADFRIIAEIRDKELIVIAIEIGHRSKIYQ
jgi:addiction module toxin, relE/stbE family